LSVLRLPRLTVHRRLSEIVASLRLGTGTRGSERQDSGPVAATWRLALARSLTSQEWSADLDLRLRQCRCSFESIEGYQRRLPECAREERGSSYIVWRSRSCRRPRSRARGHRSRRRQQVGRDREW